MTSPSGPFQGPGPRSNAGTGNQPGAGRPGANPYGPLGPPGGRGYGRPGSGGGFGGRGPGSGPGGGFAGRGAGAGPGAGAGGGGFGGGGFGGGPGRPAAPGDATRADDNGAADPADKVIEDVAVVEDPLVAASRQRDEYLDMLRRVQADFENYKKRMQRQQTEQVERASESLVAKLLPALDAFALTRAHLTDENADSAEVTALLAASAMVADALSKEGLESLGVADEPFDPTVHDAVEHAPAAAPGSGTDPGGTAAEVTGPVVTEVLRPGYRWKGRVIRPAMVRVRG